MTAGFGSLDSTEGDPPFREANVSKVEISLNGDVVEPLAFVCHKDDAQSQGRVVCKKLQAVLPRQQVCYFALDLVSTSLLSYYSNACSINHHELVL